MEKNKQKIWLALKRVCSEGMEGQQTEDLHTVILLDFKKEKISGGFVRIGETEPAQGFAKQFFETAFDKMNDSFEKPIF